MHVALVANTAWLDEELSTLKHLVVGLIDEGVRVTCVLPERAVVDEAMPFGQRIAWQESSLGWWNAFRLGGLSRSLESAEIDLVHALDGRLWRGALKAGGAAGLPVVLHANSQLDVDLLRRLSRRLTPGRCAVVTATAPLTEAMRPLVQPGVSLETVHAGVAVPREPVALPSSAEGLFVTVTGTGRLDGAYEGLLEGVARIIARYPGVQFFLDGQLAGQHEIWKFAEQLGLLGHLSLVPRRLGHRELLLRSHLIIQPQAMGRSRSLILRAMGAGVPILAQDHPSSSEWAQLLSELFDDLPRLHEQAARGRVHVSQSRSVSRMAEHTLQLYRRMVDETIPFQAATAG